MSFVPIVHSSTSATTTYKSGGGNGILRVGSDFSFDWISAIDETVQSVQPFNQTARLKQSRCFRMAELSAEADLEAAAASGSLTLSNDLYFKPDMSPQSFAGLLTRKLKKPKKKKRSKKDKSECVVKFSSTKKADTKLLLVRQRPEKVTKKKQLEKFLIQCDDCETKLPPLDMKIHHKRFHLEVECPDCCCLFIGEQRLSEHICVPKEEDPAKLKSLDPKARRRSSVSPPPAPDGDCSQFISGDELISSARSVTDDESEENVLAELIQPLAGSAVLVTRPSTPTRIMAGGLVDNFDLGLVHLDGIIIPQVDSPDRKVAATGNARSQVDKEPAPKDVTEDGLQASKRSSSSSCGVNLGHIVDNDYLDLPTP